MAVTYSQNGVIVKDKGTSGIIYRTDFSNFDLTTKIDYPEIGNPKQYGTKLSYNKVLTNTRQYTNAVNTLDISWSMDGDSDGGLLFSNLDWSKSKRIKTIFCNKVKYGYCINCIKLPSISGQWMGFTSFNNSKCMVSDDELQVSTYNGTSYFQTVYDAKWYTNNEFLFTKWNTYDIEIDVKNKMVILKCNGIIMLVIHYTGSITSDLIVSFDPSGDNNNASINSIAYFSIEDIDV
jgi:hypothetical protein